MRSNRREAVLDTLRAVEMSLYVAHNLAIVSILSVSRELMAPAEPVTKRRMGFV